MLASVLGKRKRAESKKHPYAPGLSQSYAPG